MKIVGDNACERGQQGLYLMRLKHLTRQLVNRKRRRVAKAEKV